MKFPRSLFILWKTWLRIGHFIGEIMSTIILTILWIVCFGLYAIIWKPLSFIRRKKAKDSLWVASQKNTVDSMRYPF